MLGSEQKHLLGTTPIMKRALALISDPHGSGHGLCEQLPG
jgi:hypothetical protein